MDFSDVCQGDDGTFYASSLSGGIFTFKLSDHPNQLDLDTIKLKELEVKELDNIVISIAKTHDGALWFVSDNRIVKYNAAQQMANIIDRLAIGSEVIFGEAQPLVLNDYLVIGTTVGRMQIDLSTPTGYCPELILDNADTLVIEWGDEIPKIRATALDFRLPRLIQYAWKEHQDSSWTNLGNNGTLSLEKLLPGTHQFEIRSTDAKEIWTHNNRTITIIVCLSLWQKLAFVLAIILLVCIICWAWKANKRLLPTIQHQKPIADGIQPSQPVVVVRDQQFIEQVTKIVEEHIDDPMLDVEMMTGYMNTSRTILYTKFKDLLDTTPASFITDIRLKRAIQLLETKQYRINEVAIMCGFSDPKYFTRHFKQRMGVSPAKYLELKTENL